MEKLNSNLMGDGQPSKYEVIKEDLQILEQLGMAI